MLKLKCKFIRDLLWFMHSVKAGKMPFSKEDRRTIRNYGCFVRYVNETKVLDDNKINQGEEEISKDAVSQIPIYFAFNFRHFMGSKVFQKKYTDWTKSVNKDTNDCKKWLCKNIRKYNPWRCLKSFLLSFTTGRVKVLEDKNNNVDVDAYQYLQNHKQSLRQKQTRFYWSTNIFRWYASYLKHQSTIWSSFTRGLNNRIKSYRDYNTRKYEEYKTKLAQMDNQYVAIPVSISKTAMRIRFYVSKIIKNGFMVFGRTITTILGAIKLLIRTLWNLFCYAITIIYNLILNVIVHVSALILCLLFTILLVLTIIYWSLTRFSGFCIKVLLRIYYCCMYGLIRLFNMFPEVVDPANFPDDMHYSRNNRTWRQILVINKERFDELCDISEAPY